jgi:hypothetical protein
MRNLLIHVLSDLIFMMNITVYIPIILHFILTIELIFRNITFYRHLFTCITSIENILLHFHQIFDSLVSKISYVLDIVRAPRIDSW